MTRRINPMGWAKHPTEKPAFNPKENFDSFEQGLCARLKHIFVTQMGLAQNIELALDPATGQKMLNFTVPHGSQIQDSLASDEINGMPIKITVVNP